MCRSLVVCLNAARPKVKNCLCSSLFDSVAQHWWGLCRYPASMKGTGTLMRPLSAYNIDGIQPISRRTAHQVARLLLVRSGGRNLHKSCRSPISQLPLLHDSPLHTLYTATMSSGEHELVAYERDSVRHGHLDFNGSLGPDGHFDSNGNIHRIRYSTARQTAHI